MAHTAYFKFPDTEIDVIPEALSSEIVGADFKAHLLTLYTDDPTNVAQGKLIFTHSGSEARFAPVLMIRAFINAYDAGGAGNDHLVFHVADFSETFRIIPPEA